jgi:tetratricopeptide (TPR) repeat protein
VKLLTVFTGVCLLLAGTVTWAIFSGVRAGRAARESSPPPTLHHVANSAPTASQPRDSDKLLVETGEPAAVEPPATPTFQPLVHWAGDPDLRAAGRRLQLAQATLRDDPEHPGALRDAAEAFAALGQWSPAADTLARRVALDPVNVALRFDHATALAQAHRWIDAIAVLQQVVREEPGRGEAWFNLAIAHQAAGHLADARGAWDRVIELIPTPEAFSRRGEVLLDLLEWGAAASDFEMVLREQPDAADATLNRALALSKAGRGEEARVLLIAFTDRHPCHVPALNRLAELAWMAYQAAPTESAAVGDEARQWWQRSLECDPEQPPVREALEQAR